MIPPTKKVTTMVFEERMVTDEKWLKPISWQMTLRLELSEPPCVLLPPHHLRGGATLRGLHSLC